MLIGFYSPYMDSLGGGERYVLTLASHWSKRHTIHIFWDDLSIVDGAKERLSIDISNTKIVRNIFRGGNVLKKLFLSRTYDVLFFLTDGSIPMSAARKNILHFQVPFAHIPAPDWKLHRFQAVVCNSRFTKDHIDARLGDRATVIYPPVKMIGHSSGKKQKVILSVGRFSGHFAAKKQEVLIQSFLKGKQEGLLNGWELVLAGGLLATDRPYFNGLEQLAKGNSVRLLPNISYSELVGLYQKASLYWHAAGSGETKPENMEHFGITTVEAMSAGCVPLVYDAGGQKEIVEDGVSGFLWQTTKELLEKTKQCTEQPSLWKKIASQAIARAKSFDERRFCEDFDRLLVGLTS